MLYLQTGRIFKMITSCNCCIGLKTFTIIKEPSSSWECLLALWLDGKSSTSVFWFVFCIILFYLKLLFSFLFFFIVLAVLNEKSFWFIFCEGGSVCMYVYGVAGGVLLKIINFAHGLWLPPNWLHEKIMLATELLLLFVLPLL